MQQDTITHDFPVWREKANFILAVRLSNQPDVSQQWKWEQLWARQIEENIFEICCIPFFAYGLAIGDLVTTTPKEEKQYVIDKVIKKSGYQTFRIWILDVNKKDSIIEKLTSLRYLVEVRGQNSKLIAINSMNNEASQILEKYLTDLEFAGELNYEHGNSNLEMTVE